LSHILLCNFKISLFILKTILDSWEISE
jgi:hypothetical protein